MGKSHQEYTIADMQRLEGGFFKNIYEGTELEKIVSNIKYFTNMVNSLSKPYLLTTPFLDVFDKDTFKDQEIKDLNKALHGIMEARKEKLRESQPVDLMHDLLTAQSTELKIYKNTDIEKLKRSLNSLQESVKNYLRDASAKYRKYEEYLGYASKYAQEAEGIQEKIDAFVEGSLNEELMKVITSIIDEGEWKFLGYHDNLEIVIGAAPRDDLSDQVVDGQNMRPGLMFLSTSDIICSHTNPSAGINEQVNFGRPIISVQPSGLIKEVRFVYNSFNTGGDVGGGSQHPHISSEGSVCWGSASTRYSKLVSSGKVSIRETLGLLKTLLETYCPDNPYTSLNWYTSRTERMPSFLTEESLALIPEDIREKELDEIERPAEFGFIKIVNEFRNSCKDIDQDLKTVINLKRSRFADDFYKCYYQEGGRTRTEESLFEQVKKAFAEKEILLSCEGVNLYNRGYSSASRSLLVHGLNYHGLLKGAKVIVEGYSTMMTIEEIPLDLIFRDSNHKYAQVKMTNGNTHCFSDIHGFIELGGENESTN